MLTLKLFFQYLGVDCCTDADFEAHCSNVWSSSKDEQIAQLAGPAMMKLMMFDALLDVVFAGRKLSHASKTTGNFVLPGMQSLTKSFKYADTLAKQGQSWMTEAASQSNSITMHYQPVTEENEEEERLKYVLGMMQQGGALQERSRYITSLAQLAGAIAVMTSVSFS